MGHEERALDLYIYNCQICEALYTPIHVLEVTLRNNFHKSLARVYGNEWYNNISNKLLAKEQNNIDDVKKRLLYKNKQINANNIVSTLSLGFWVGLLVGEYENNLWRPCLYQAFPDAAKPFTRRNVKKKLTVIKDLRNRIAHHEPVYSSKLEYAHNTILEVISWMCEDTSEWVKNNSRFDEVYVNNIELETTKELVKVI